MVDRSMPEPSNEYLSSRPQPLPHALAAMVKNFRGRLQLSRTLIALTTVRRDIERSNVQQNFQAKEELRNLANAKARELKFKEKRDWWS